MRRFYYLIVLFFIFNIYLFAQSDSSFVVIDANTNKVLIEEKSNKKHKIASLTKIWTALIVLENSNLDDEVVVSKRATLQQGSSIYLKENQIYTIKDLVHGMLLRSGNDASVALAEHIAGSEEKFVKLMNKRAKEFGIKNTKFVDVTGLGNNISTAKDVAVMFELALKNSKFKDISGQSSYKNSLDGQIWKNKHKLVVENSKAFAGKTGYTKQSGRTLATAFYDEKSSKSFIVVTLNEKDDWKVHKSLAQKVLAKAK